MTRESIDFYSCRKCNGEAVWIFEEGWRYDCSHREKQKK